MGAARTVGGRRVVSRLSQSDVYRGLDDSLRLGADVRRRRAVGLRHLYRRGLSSSRRALRRTVAVANTRRRVGRVSRAGSSLAFSTPALSDVASARERLLEYAGGWRWVGVRILGGAP